MANKIKLFFSANLLCVFLYLQGKLSIQKHEELEELFVSDDTYLDVLEGIVVLCKGHNSCEGALRSIQKNLAQLPTAQPPDGSGRWLDSSKTDKVEAGAPRNEFFDNMIDAFFAQEEYIRAAPNTYRERNLKRLNDIKRDFVNLNFIKTEKTRCNPRNFQMI